MINNKEIQSNDIKKLLIMVYKSYQQGIISERKAHREASLLNMILKAIEVSDLENRLINIENILRNE